MSSPDYRPWPTFTRRDRLLCASMAKPRGLHVLTLDDARYPPLLRQIPDPPPVLFVKGNVDVLVLPQIAIVGSRRPTADGRKNARAFAAGLSAAGYVIASGMAMGIDTEAHRGALINDGVTIAVLGEGLDSVASKNRRAFAEEIAGRGAVVSEFLPDTYGQPEYFPCRNRIISGLAHGVVVIEAAEQSGSLITARLAGEQGREVFALPGSIHNLVARGCHKLIRQGAKLAESVSDILEEFPALAPWEQQRAVAGYTPALTRQQQKVLAEIAYDPVPVDTLLQRTGYELTELYTHLMTLELHGRIVNRADGYVLSTP